MELKTRIDKKGTVREISMNKLMITTLIGTIATTMNTTSSIRKTELPRKKTTTIEFNTKSQRLKKLSLELKNLKE